MPWKESSVMEERLRFVARRASEPARWTRLTLSGGPWAALDADPANAGLAHLAGIEFKAMPDEAVAKTLRHLFLQPLDLRIAEFNHLARIDINQMIMMLRGDLLISKTAITESVALKNARVLK